MPVQNDSIIHCIKHTNPRRNKIHPHMSSIFPGPNTTKEQRMTKLNMIQGTQKQRAVLAKK